MREYGFSLTRILPCFAGYLHFLPNIFPEIVFRNNLLLIASPSLFDILFFNFDIPYKFESNPSSSVSCKYYANKWRMKSSLTVFCKHYQTCFRQPMKAYESLQLWYVVPFWYISLWYISRQNRPVQKFESFSNV